MIPGVMFDLRSEDFHTHAEMDEAMEGRIEQCDVEFDAFVPVAIVMHESQVKWLKLELFERKQKSTTELRKMVLNQWKHIPVFVVDDWERIPCPDCGRIHEDDIREQ